jgi:hypothetical protein
VVEKQRITESDGRRRPRPRECRARAVALGALQAGALVGAPLGGDWFAQTDSSTNHATVTRTL